MERKRMVHQLDIPYAVAQWPQIDPEDQAAMLELLSSLLDPVGQYRRLHVQPSKGKRAKAGRQQNQHDPRPEAPELTHYLDVGLANITRVLGGLSCQQQNNNAATQMTGAEGNSTGYPAFQHYAVIFVVRSGHPSAFHSHFPQMVATASGSLPPGKEIKLVGLSKACEEVLSKCLGIPRVSCVALRAGAPNAGALLDFALANVPPIEIPWLERAQTAQYQETNIRSTGTTVGPKRQKR